MLGILSPGCKRAILVHAVLKFESPTCAWKIGLISTKIFRSRLSIKVQTCAEVRVLDAPAELIVTEKKESALKFDLQAQNGLYTSQI